MKRGFGVVLAIALASVPTSPEARVQCSCNEVKAEGEGDTSCSVHESNGKCTIDYNLFPEDLERAAAEVLSRLMQLRYRRLESSSDFWQIGEEERVGTALVYSLIAAVKSVNQDEIESSLRNSILFSGGFDGINNDIFQSINQKFDQTNETFSALSDFELERLGDPRTFAQPSIFDQDFSGLVIIAPGCIEIFSPPHRYMYKAWWSASRRMPGCVSDPIQRLR